MCLRSFVFVPVLLGLCGLLVGCGKAPPNADSIPKAPLPNGSGDVRNADVGAPLYAPVAPPAYPTTGIRNEQIVISNALVTFEQRHIVSAEVDGAIDLFATEIKESDLKKVMDKEPDRIVYHPQDVQKKTPLRLLREGDEVTAGQILAIFDSRQAHARIKGLQEMKEAAGTAAKFAEDGVGEAKKRVDQLQRSLDAGVGSKADLIEAQLTLARFRENAANAIQTIAKTSADLKDTEVMLDRHWVRSRLNGTIRTIDKFPGHYVKASEKLMELEATDRVRIEGQLDIQHLGKVQRGMTVTVEPASSSAAQASHTDHRQAVTGIAVAVVKHADEIGPLVVSVGADGSALVWDPNPNKKPNRQAVAHNLPHPVGVRSVAAAPATAKASLVITGADDGKIRIWDVSNPAKLPDRPKTEPEDSHTSAVHSIAVSPDGRFFASAAGRDVFVWEVATGKKLYVLPAEHRDNVTAVSFTPQNTLVTTSKDGTLKVWKLGADRAAVVRTIDHRAGAVEALGVSRDGARVLFDQDKTRIDLVDPANGQTIGQVQNVSSAGSFATLALFEPDDVAPGTPADQLPPYGIATAGGDGDLKGTLQYWHAPRTGGRGTEVGRLITPGRAPVTAAAFGASGSKRFVVVGTSAGGVHLWETPTAAAKKHEGKIVNIDATDTRYVTVRVEMSNRELKLIDKSAATIIINP